MPGDELAALVRRWDVLLLGQADELPWPVRTSGTVLRPGASEVAILELEARLGVELPPSYRSFLALTDGAWAQVGWGVKGLWDEPDDGNEEWALGFLDTARVGWFRDREPSYVDIWTSGDWQLEDDSSNPGFRRLIPECEYLDHDRDQDVVHAKGGHVAYALQISGDVDGYTVLLNPLVVSQHGEWEAWDFGSKLPGANRYRAFDALLAADVARLEREAVAPPTFDVDSVVPVALDESRPIEERVNAANQAVWGGERERVLPVLALALADRSLDVGVRQAAAQALGRIDDPRAVAALVAAAGDPEPRLQSAVLPPLASRDEPESRRSALSILTAPDVEDFVVRSVWPGGAETLWQAWRVREDLRLLEWLAYCHDRRACAPLAEAIVDPDVDASIRERLIGYAWWPGTRRSFRRSSRPAHSPAPRYSRSARHCFTSAPRRRVSRCSCARCGKTIPSGGLRASWVGYAGLKPWTYWSTHSSMIPPHLSQGHLAGTTTTRRVTHSWRLHTGPT